MRELELGRAGSRGEARTLGREEGEGHWGSGQEGGRDRKKGMGGAGGVYEGGALTAH